MRDRLAYFSPRQRKQEFAGGKTGARAKFREAAIQAWFRLICRLFPRATNDAEGVDDDAEVGDFILVAYIPFIRYAEWPY